MNQDKDGINNSLNNTNTTISTNQMYSSMEYQVNDNNNYNTHQSVQEENKNNSKDRKIKIMCIILLLVIIIITIIVIIHIFNNKKNDIKNNGDNIISDEVAKENDIKSNDDNIIDDEVRKESEFLSDYKTGEKLYFNVPDGFSCPGKKSPSVSCGFYSKKVNNKMITLTYEFGESNRFIDYFSTNEFVFNDFNLENGYYGEIDEHIYSYELGNKQISYKTYVTGDSKDDADLKHGIWSYFNLEKWTIMVKIEWYDSMQLSVEEALKYAYSSSFSTSDGKMIN